MHTIAFILLHKQQLIRTWMNWVIVEKKIARVIVAIGQVPIRIWLSILIKFLSIVQWIILDPFTICVWQGYLLFRVVFRLLVNA